MIKLINLLVLLAPMILCMVSPARRSAFYMLIWLPPLSMTFSMYTFKSSSCYLAKCSIVTFTGFMLVILSRLDLRSLIAT